MDKIETKIRGILIGIDKDYIEHKDGWWSTQTGSEFGERKLNEIIEFVKQLNYNPIIRE